MDAELTHFLGRKRYERRQQGNVNHRNGSYRRNFTLKGIGGVDIQIPRDRKGNFKTHVIPRSKRYEDAIRQDLCLMFLTGISTRTLSMISKKLIGRRISAGEVSNANKELIEAAKKWRTRDLSEKLFKYMFVDGVCFDMRIGKSIETVPFLAKVTKKFKMAVADDLRSIFYASSKKKAKEFIEQFTNKWEKDFPTAVKCLDNSIDACLTFFDFPEEEWISLRTTNIIERLNKEFKRRTKPMEIVVPLKAGLYAPGFYMFEDGVALEIEHNWESE